MWGQFSFLQRHQAKVLRRADETDSIVLNLTILNSHIEYPVSAETLQKITK